MRGEEGVGGEMGVCGIYGGLDVEGVEGVEVGGGVGEIVVKSREGCLWRE